MMMWTMWIWSVVGILLIILLIVVIVKLLKKLVLAPQKRLTSTSTCPPMQTHS